MTTEVVRWPPTSVLSLKQSLDELEEVVKEVNSEGDNRGEASWLARLLVVRSCGYLEQVVLQTGLALIHKSSAGSVRNFSQSWYPTHRNPSPEKIVDWVGRFNPEWSVELQEILDAEDEIIQRELSLLVDRRNRIAHGLPEGIGVRKALDLKGTAITIADWFLLRFNPSR
jgi:hypothetical protein